MKLQLVIPMSGLGSRFAKVGYTDPKPLIEVHGRPMIEWVLRMFPGEETPLFICREEHMKQTHMASVLKELKPKGEVATIKGEKLGPVAALMAAADRIDDNTPVLVSYCDYYMNWDYAAFLQYLDAGSFAGAIPCYTGFHPHLLPTKNLYASCRTNDSGLLSEIREKHSFEADKTKTLHSPGVYFFSSGRLLKDYSNRLMAADDSLNGEYYVSMIYNHLVRDRLRVGVPANVDYFCQWGTPEDLSEYLYWNSVVRRRL